MALLVRLFDVYTSSLALLAFATFADAHLTAISPPRISHNVAHAPSRPQPAITTATVVDAIQLASSSSLVSTPATTPPAELRRLRLRRDDAVDNFKTICGYLGGDAALPATCTAGSHCAVDVGLGVVGCCPDVGDCARGGVFTACVDSNSSPQTLRDPYVYTCHAGRVCYRNTFDGGFYQYGCASASQVATRVASIASGRPPLDLSRISLQLTATPTPLATPIVIGSLRPSSSTTTSDGSSSVDDGDSALKTTSPSASAAADADAPPKGSRSPSMSAIAGGVIGAIFGLVAIVVVCAMLLRRRGLPGRHRRGPDQDDQYIRPMTDAHHRFEPLSSSQSAGPETIMTTHHPLGSSNLAAAPSAEHLPMPAPPRPVSHGGNSDYPLSRDYDGPPPGTAITTGEPSTHDNDNSTLATDDSASTYRRRRGSGGGVLWQQNRRQRRNLVWI